jgi:hypothetical protein
MDRAVFRKNMPEHRPNGNSSGTFPTDGDERVNLVAIRRNETGVQYSTLELGHGEVRVQY